MRAVQITRYGPPETLAVADVPPPEPGPKDVLVRVHAAGVNPIDWKIRSGQTRFIIPMRLPRTPGFDIAGEVVELGERAEGFQRGDAVFCFSDHFPGGGYAEQAVVSASVCARKPQGLDFTQAAATPLAALTALQSLRDCGRLQTGQDVLINGASGGVGTFGVQIAKAIGARVTGVCSERNLDFVRELGADEVIDYRRDDFTRMDRRWHVVFDAVANRSFWQCRRVLTERGRYINTLPYPQHYLAQVLSLVGRRRAFAMLAKPSGDDLRQVAEWIDAGRIRPVIDEVFPLDAATAAHRKSEQGRAQGKIVLRVVATS